MPTTLKLGCVTNFDMLFLVMGFISLVDEIQFMLISSRHICTRSIDTITKAFSKEGNLLPGGVLRYISDGECEALFRFEISDFGLFLG